jgi:hypothetical protein
MWFDALILSSFNVQEEQIILRLVATADMAVFLHRSAMVADNSEPIFPL